jgi:hypothetical protein
LVVWAAGHLREDMRVGHGTPIYDPE